MPHFKRKPHCLGSTPHFLFPRTPGIVNLFSTFMDFFLLHTSYRCDLPLCLFHLAFSVGVLLYSPNQPWAHHYPLLTSHISECVWARHLAFICLSSPIILARLFMLQTIPLDCQMTFQCINVTWLFIYSAIDGHVSCLYIMSIVNNATGSILHMFFLRYTHGNSTFAG